MSRVTRLGPDAARGAFAGWVQRAHGDRTAASVLAQPVADDIADPVGRPLVDYRQARDRLKPLCADLAVALTSFG